MRSPPKHYQSPDQEQARFNRETVDALRHVLGRAGVDYDVVALTVGTGATQVRHRLGRRHAGWVVVDLAANTNVWRSALPSGASQDDLFVQAGASVPASILVF